jgi:FAD dependent oxidoreductase
MLVQNFSEVTRGNKTVTTQSNLVVVGGGLAGVCCAIAAARDGITVTLVQDRPVLGGNASSEVRLWTLGATSHMGNNNRWSREGGIIDEILVENMYRNKEGNTLIFDTILLEKVVVEKNITLIKHLCLRCKKIRCQYYQSGSGILQPKLNYLRIECRFILRCLRRWNCWFPSGSGF